MNYRFWTRLALLVGVLAASLHAVRVYRVSYSNPVSFGLFLSVCLTAVLGSIAFFRLGASGNSRRGTFLVAAGAFLVLTAAIVEMFAGLARVAMLPLDQPRELGFARVTLGSFTASYREDGNLLECGSTLVLDLEGCSESLTVVSGSPMTVAGVSIFQLGFSGGREWAEGGPRSKLGFLAERASWPFRTGLALLDIGALFLLFSRRGKVKGN